MEVIARLCMASIIHLAIVLPMHFLAENTHKLCHWSSSDQSMGIAIYLLHSAMSEVHSISKLMLDYDYIKNIFKPLNNDVPDLKDYVTYLCEEKSGNVVGSKK
jgi:hypothetical protein